MKLEKLLALGFFIVASLNAGHAAWEKVRMPEVNERIIEMEFANAGLGYALVAEEYSPYNFLVYRNGAWTLERLPGMFLGHAWYISLLNSGYGWVVGIHGGMDWALYTARSYGGGRWEKTSNPYETGNFPGDYPALSVAGVEDVWVLNDAVNGFLHYKDGEWEELHDVLPPELGAAREVCFVNENEGWVSGLGGFAHYANGEWRYVSGPYIYNLDFTAPDDGWGTGPGGVYHCDGSSWTVSLSCLGYVAHTIGFYDRNNGWAAFSKYENKPRLFKFESGKWREIKILPKRGAFYPCPVSNVEAWFLGSEYVPGEGYKNISWHWYTEPSVKPASLGKIKTLFK